MDNELYLLLNYQDYTLFNNEYKLRFSKDQYENKYLKYKTKYLLLKKSKSHQ